MESLITEEWMLSNVLNSTDLYHDDVQGYNTGVSKFLKSYSHDQLNPDDSGFQDDFDSWLTEATSIGNLDSGFETSTLTDHVLPEVLDEVVNQNASLLDADEQMAQVLAELEAALDPKCETPIFEAPADILFEEPMPDAPSSPVEESSLQPSFKPMIKYVEPSTIDVRSLTSHSQIVMDEMSVLHLPDNSEALFLLKVLSGDEMTEEEVVLEMPSPPSSPEAMVPGSPLDSDDDYVPSRKRKSSSQGSSRSLKALKPNEKKERKKLQNKNAATKYRLKKRAEDEDVKHELCQLENRNDLLKRKVEDLNSEITYMKGLLNEVLKGKGLRIK